MAKAMLCLGKKPFRRYRDILFTKDYLLSAGELSKRRARHIHIVWRFDRESLICERTLFRFLFIFQQMCCFIMVFLRKNRGKRCENVSAGKWEKFDAIESEKSAITIDGDEQSSSENFRLSLFFFRDIFRQDVSRNVYDILR